MYGSKYIIFEVLSKYLTFDEYKVAGLFDPGRPATVARAKRVCDCCLRIPFHNLECVTSFSFFTECAKVKNKPARSARTRGYAHTTQSCDKTKPYSFIF